MNSFYQAFGKRAFDLIFSIFVLLFSVPVLIIVGLLIKILSPGPVIFRQKRIGRNGQVFTLYKFRTMVKNAEKLKEKYLKLNEADGPVFKISNDPRFSNFFSKLLVRSGLDELPQVINILKGEMSWVGPRPLPTSEAKKISPKIRESVLPGITSSWVILGSHSLSFKQWMDLDREYINHVSFRKDFQVIIKTFCLSCSAAKKIFSG